MKDCPGPFTPFNLGMLLSFFTICMGPFVTLTLLSNGFCTIKALWRWTLICLWKFTEAIYLDVAKGCARNWLGMQVHCSSAAMRNEFIICHIGSGTKQRRLSGRCAKTQGRQPSVNQEENTGLSYFSIRFIVEEWFTISTLYSNLPVFRFSLRHTLAIHFFTTMSLIRFFIVKGRHI